MRGSARRDAGGTAGRASDAVLAFVVVLTVSSLVATLGATVEFCAELAWTDLIHSNPNRTTSNVAAMMRLSPVYGFVSVLFLGGLPILLGAALSALAVLASGRLSRAGLTAVSVVCAFVFVHGCYAGAEQNAEDPDWRQSSPPWSTLVGGVALLTASLLCGRRAFHGVVRAKGG